MRNRVEVMHGVNLDQLGRRDPEHYPRVTLTELEVVIGRYARELGLEPSFSHTNHEGEFCESLHEASETVHGLVLNPGAWTHYSYAIRDALEVCGLPAVEVHLSDIEHREEWRRFSVVADIASHRVIGRGPDGYHEALQYLAGTVDA